MNENWINIQNSSSEILYSGLKSLLNSPKIKLNDLPNLFSGNFLISNDIMHYIGDLKNINELIDIVNKREESFFYQNYKELESLNDFTPKGLLFNDFEIRLLQTKFASCELVEFGIENIPSYLNTAFHKRKGLKIFGELKIKKLPENIDDKLWFKIQESKEILFNQGFELLENLESNNWINLNNKELLLRPEFLNSSRNFFYPGVLVVEHSDYGVFHIQENYRMGDVYMNFIGGKLFKSEVLRKICKILNVHIEKIQFKNQIKPIESQEKISKFISELKAKFIPVRIGRKEFTDYLKNRYEL